MSANRRATDPLVVSLSSHEHTRSSFDRFRTSGAVAVALFAALLITAYLVDPLAEGLNATFFGDANWTSDIVRSEVDARLAESAFAGWHGTPPDTFSITWSGAILVPRDGTYTFATASDDGSWVRGSAAGRRQRRQPREAARGRAR